MVRHEAVVLDGLLGEPLLLLVAVLPHQGDLPDQVVWSLLHPFLVLDVQEDRAVHKDHEVDDPVEGGAGVLLAHDGPAAAVLAGGPPGGADLPYGHAGPLLADLAGAEPLQELDQLLVVLVQLGEDVGGEGLDQVEELGVVEPHKVDDLPGVHSPEGEEGANGL